MVKIFVGNCSDLATNSDLRQLFSRYGKVVEADIINGKGFGFVHMESQDCADEAVAALDGLEYKGKKFRVELSNSRGQRPVGGGGAFRSRDSRDMDSGAGRTQSRDFPSRNGGGEGFASRATSRSLPYDEPYRRPADPYESKSSSYRSPTSSYSSRDRSDSRGAPPPVSRAYDSYDTSSRRPTNVADDSRRRAAPADDSYGRPLRGRSPPPMLPKQRSRSPLSWQQPPRGGRSPPRSYGMSAASGRYSDDDRYESRRVGPMSRGRSPP